MGAIDLYFSWPAVSHICLVLEVPESELTCQLHKCELLRQKQLRGWPNWIRWTHHWQSERECCSFLLRCPLQQWLLSEVSFDPLYSIIPIICKNKLFVVHLSIRGAKQIDIIFCEKLLLFQCWRQWLLLRKKSLLFDIYRLSGFPGILS